jgi:hypothetical protein
LVFWKLMTTDRTIGHHEKTPKMISSGSAKTSVLSPPPRIQVTGVRRRPPPASRRAPDRSAPTVGWRVHVLRMPPSTTASSACGRALAELTSSLLVVVPTGAGCGAAQRCARPHTVRLPLGCCGQLAESMAR